MFNFAISKKLNSKFKKAISIFKRRGFFFLFKELLNVLIYKNFIINSDKKIFVRYKLNEIFYNMHQDGLDVSPVSYKDKKIYVLSDIDIPKENIKSLGKLINNLDNFSSEDIKSSVFYICFNFDTDALKYLKIIKDNDGIFIPHLSTTKTPYRFTDKIAFNALVRTWKQIDRVSHLRMDIHENLCEALNITKDLEGCYIEIGVYLGGSALTVLNYINELNKSDLDKKKVYLLDTFEGFNYEAAEKSSDAIWKGTHTLYGIKNTLEYVNETLKTSQENFSLIKSNICLDSIPDEIKKISIANIDVDLYEPTKDALIKVAPLIIKNGIIIVEDALSTPKLYGAYLAMNEFLDTEIGKTFYPVHKLGQYFLIKK